MSHAIEFYLGEKHYAVIPHSSTQTLLDWLRDAQGRKGTKEGCNEGDCGACSVLVIRLGRDGLEWQSQNACLSLLPSLHAAQILTVEDISQENALHDIQQKMVRYHASQCGFCTPGFVISMVAYAKNAPQASEGASDEAASDDAMNLALAGNLCRCTGYGPIAKAMKDVLADQHRQEWFEAMEKEITTRLSEISSPSLIDLHTAEGSRVSIPFTGHALARMYNAFPRAVLVAGGTDIGVAVNKKFHSFMHGIFIAQIAELAQVEFYHQSLYIGAGVTFQKALGVLPRYFPGLAEVLRHIAAIQVRNVATLCGNIANGSPIGDGPPLWMALNASLHLRKGEERRVIPIESYFLAYGKQDRQEGEFIEGLSIPVSSWPDDGERPEPEGDGIGHIPAILPKDQIFFRAYKVAKRKEQDISAVLGAFWVQVNAKGIISTVRLAYGGMAGIPKRASHTEKALLGKPWNEKSISLAQKAIKEDFSPLSDHRASAWYRMVVAENLLLRFYSHSVSGEGSV